MCISQFLIILLVIFIDISVRQSGMEMVRKRIISNKAQNISEDKAVENKSDQKERKVISKNTKDEESSKFHYWTEKEEKCLVESRANMEDEFTSSKSHATLWQKLTDKLQENNINVSVKQAQDKWKNLKKEVKRSCRPQ